MTLNEMLEKCAVEIAEEAVNDKEKGAIMEDFVKIFNDVESGEKINGCELFELCHKFNQAFPDYVSALVAMSMIAKFGIDAGLVEFGNADELDVDDILGGAEIEGEE